MSARTDPKTATNARRLRPPILMAQILSSSPALVEHMAQYLGIGLTRGDHFRGLMLQDKLCRFLGRREWILLQVRQLTESERNQYRLALQKLLLELSPPSLGESFGQRLVELGLAFRIDTHDKPLMPLEYAFLSDAAWTLQGSLAQAMVAYMAQGVIPRQTVRESASYLRALHALAGTYYQVRRSWASQIPALSLRQLLAMETLQSSPSPQPAARLAILLGTGSPEVFSWPRYMRYHGTGSHNPLQEILLLGLARPKDLDPSSALREISISLEADKPVARAIPRLFKRFSRPSRAARDTSLVRVTPPGDFALDLLRLLVATSLMPPPSTKDSTPSMIHVDRLSRLLALQQPYQRFLLAVSWDCGWLQVTMERGSPVIVPSAEAEDLMARGPRALFQIAVAQLPTLLSWDESRSCPCRLASPGPMTHLVGRLRSYLIELTSTMKAWVPVASLSGYLIGIAGFRRLLATAPDLAPISEILDSPEHSASPLLAGLATTIWWSQRADMARDQANVLYIRALQPPLEAPPVETSLPLRVAANGEFFLPLTISLQRLRQAAEFAEIIAVDHACRFRISRASLNRAQKSEKSARDVKEFLACELPQNVLHLIEETFSAPLK
ncbi:hypothetical protein JXA88_09810 [Candidatus Fermentibacteria bacterium]|nr:hypothetical protein [Candidatus Fermentibacteria bacterium]